MLKPEVVFHVTSQQPGDNELAQHMLSLLEPNTKHSLALRESNNQELQDERLAEFHQLQDVRWVFE